MRKVFLYFNLICCGAFAQNDDLIQQFFADKDNFIITKSLGGNIPETYQVFNQTNPWNAFRFKISDTPLSDSALKKMKQNEYHPYNHTYLFKDTALSNLFSGPEKNNLHAFGQKLKPRQLNLPAKNVKLIPALANAPLGFFFSVCEPVISSDGKYAFIDLTVYEKTKYTKKLSEAYFATVCVLYRKSAVGWEKLKVIQQIFL